MSRQSAIDSRERAPDGRSAPLRRITGKREVGLVRAVTDAHFPSFGHEELAYKEFLIPNPDEADLSQYDKRGCDQRDAITDLVRRVPEALRAHVGGEDSDAVSRLTRWQRTRGVAKALGVTTVGSPRDSFFGGLFLLLR